MQHHWITGRPLSSCTSFPRKQHTRTCNQWPKSIHVILPVMGPFVALTGTFTFSKSCLANFLPDPRQDHMDINYMNVDIKPCLCHPIIRTRLNPHRSPPFQQLWCAMIIPLTRPEDGSMPEWGLIEMQGKVELQGDGLLEGANPPIGTLLYSAAVRRCLAAMLVARDDNARF